MNFENVNFVYLLICMKCIEQYVSYAIKSKYRFKIHKSDLKTKINCFETARHFNNNCYHLPNHFLYLRAKHIEKVYCIYEN